MRHVVLVRGINVGGRRPLPMATLRALVAAAGGTEVATYLQSGNAVCSVAAGRGRHLQAALTAAVAAALGEAVPVLLRDARQWAALVAADPWAALPLAERHVTLLAGPPGAAAAQRLRALPAGAHRGALVGDAVYLHCPGGYGNTRLHNAALEAACGQVATTRNWRTVQALQGLLDGGG